MNAVSIRASKQEIDAINYLAKQRGYKFAGDYVRDILFADGGKELLEYIAFFEKGGSRASQTTDAKGGQS